MNLVRLGDVAVVIAGQSPKGENYNKSGEGMPFYQGKKDYGDKFLKPPTVWTKLVTKIARTGDLLFSVRAPVGALNFATQEICIGRGLAAIRAKSSINRNYLFYVLSNISKNLNVNTGAIFNSISKKQIEDIKFFLPPLSEQQRIVAKLDAAFAEIDYSIGITKTKIRNILIFKKKFFSLTLSKYKGSQPLINCAEFLNGYAFKSKDAVETSNTQLLRMGNLYENRLDLDRKPIFYPDKYKNEYKNFVLKSGDIVITLTGTVGKKDYGYAIKIQGADKNLLLNQRILKLHNFNNRIIDPDYLLFVLRSEPFLDKLYSTANGTRQANLSSDKIKDIHIPLPSLNEQDQIVSSFKFLEEYYVKINVCYRKKIFNLEALKNAFLFQELEAKSV